MSIHTQTLPARGRYTPLSSLPNRQIGDSDRASEHPTGIVATTCGQRGPLPESFGSTHPHETSASGRDSIAVARCLRACCRCAAVWFHRHAWVHRFGLSGTLRAEDARTTDDTAGLAKPARSLARIRNSSRDQSGGHEGWLWHPSRAVNHRDNKLRRKPESQWRGLWQTR